MKNTFFVGVSILLAIFSPNILANIKIVGPVLSIQGQSDNQTFFLWGRDLLFTSYDQDVYANSKQWYTKQTSFFIELPEGGSGTFYLDYGDNADPFEAEYQVDLCKFDVSSDISGNVFINASTLADSFVSCSLTGSAQTKDLVMHLTLNPGYFKKHGTR